MKTINIKTIDKTKWKTFKKAKPKIGEDLYVKDPINKTTICGSYEGEDYIYVPNGFLNGSNVKFKSNWIWIYINDYNRMEREFYDRLAKVSISDLVTTIVRKVINQHLVCDAESSLNWIDGAERLLEDEDCEEDD